MASDNSPRRYTQDEVNNILRRAIERQSPTGLISHDDLLETARELGIEPDQLEAAIDEQSTQGAMEAARREYVTRRRRKFYEHLRAYTIVNAILILIDFATSGGVWFFWPLFGWGIGLAFDAGDTFWPKEKDIERGARRILEKENQRIAKEQRELRRSQGFWSGGDGKKSVVIDTRSGKKSFVIDSKAGKIIIEKGDKRIEIG